MKGGGGGACMEPHPAIQPVGGRGAVRRPVQPAVRGGGGGGGRVLPTGYRLNQWNQQWRRNGSKGEGLKLIIHK